jgi:amino acid transporter
MLEIITYALGVIIFVTLSYSGYRFVMRLLGRERDVDDFLHVFWHPSKRLMISRPTGIWMPGAIVVFLILSFILSLLYFTGYIKPFDKDDWAEEYITEHNLRR